MRWRRFLASATSVILALLVNGANAVQAGLTVADHAIAVPAPNGVRAWIAKSDGQNTLSVRVPPTTTGCAVDMTVHRQTANSGFAWTAAQYLIDFKNGEDTFQYVDDGRITVHYRTLRSPSGFDLTWRGPAGRVVVTQSERSSGCATSAWPPDPRRT